MVTLVRDHALQDLLLATMLAGLIQIGAGLLKRTFTMRQVLKSVMTGFVNALAILIFMAQVVHDGAIDLAMPLGPGRYLVPSGSTTKTINPLLFTLSLGHAHDRPVQFPALAALLRPNHSTTLCPDTGSDQGGIAVRGKRFDVKANAALATAGAVRQ